MDLGEVGYEAYAAFTGGKTFDGRDMPAWEALPERIRGAWAAAACAIREAPPSETFDIAPDPFPTNGS